jgi:hypothetical protein
VIMAKDSLWELLIEQRQLSEQAVEGDPRAKTKQNEHGVHSLVNLLAATADAVMPRGQWRRPSVTTSSSSSSSSSTVTRRHLGDFHQLKMRAHAATCSRTSVSENSRPLFQLVMMAMSLPPQSLTRSWAWPPCGRLSMWLPLQAMWLRALDDKLSRTCQSSAGLQVEVLQLSAHHLSAFTKT